MDTRWIPPLGALAWLVVVWVVSPAAVLAADEPAEDGLFITVANPITSEVVSQVKEKTERARQRSDRRIRKIIYDFNPDNRPAGSSQYGPCRDLARYLLGLQDVRTIAFVHNEVSRHTVLPALACSELVMSHDARIGDALRDQPEPLGKDQERFYQEVARHGGRWPIIWKMLNKDIEVLEGRRRDDGSVWYVARGHEEKGVQIVRTEPVLLAGTIGLYTAAEAQKYGLCKLIKESRQEVADAYQLPASSLREDPLDGRSPVPFLIDVRGPVTRGLEETLRRRVRRAIGQGANFLILQLDCAGGDTIVARDLADFFRTLRDDRGQHAVMTVAYVPEQAADTAVFLALGCSEIVLGKGAVFGDFDSIVFQRRRGLKVPVEEGQYAMMRDSLAALAREQGYPELLARGFLDRQLVIHRVRAQANPSERRLLTRAELEADKLNPPPRWIDEGQIKGEGEFLKLSADLAQQLGVARHVVDNTGELYARYGLDPAKVQSTGPDWLDNLASFLRNPLVAVFLVMLGITCLILELKMPGVGLPGVIAALCFVLFFWAHSQLAGQVTMLAVLLFVLGLVLIGIEIFVLPGFGVTGVSGIILLVVSLGLATLEKKPETAQEWVDFGSTLLTFGLGLIGAGVMAMLIGRYLPSIPYANRLVLLPPGEKEAAEVLADEPLPRAELLGAIGTAATMLRPAGMARFGDEFIDVVAEGSFVPPGARVQVVEIEGNRIVVKEI
jgi:membrane-bound ClpP family serine protease